MVDTRWATMSTVDPVMYGTERRPEPGVGRQVEGRERVVEEVDVRLADQGPGDAQPLALPAGDVGPALADPRLEPAHGGTKLGGLGDLEGLPHLVVGGVGLAVAEVAGDRAREQVRPLGHQPDAVPQDVGIELADVDPADQHRARRWRRTGGRPD